MLICINSIGNCEIHFATIPTIFAYSSCLIYKLLFILLIFFIFFVSVVRNGHSVTYIHVCLYSFIDSCYISHYSSRDCNTRVRWKNSKNVQVYTVYCFTLFTKCSHYAYRLHMHNCWGCMNVIG